MFNRIVAITAGSLTIALLNGCMYRGDGPLKQIGDTDYKARLTLQGMFVAADGSPVDITGTVYADDMIAPLKYTTVFLRKKDQREIITQTTTDHAGRFVLSGLLSNDDYTVEIDSPRYTASKTFLVEPNRKNNYELFARKK